DESRVLAFDACFLPYYRAHKHQIRIKGAAITTTMLEDLFEVIDPGSRAEVLLKQIDCTLLPRHMAVIVAGTSGGAYRRCLPRGGGHRAGVEAVRATVDTCARWGVEALTLYAFSVENWKRPPFEIEALMTFVKEYLRKELENIHRNNIRFQTIGRT